MIKLHSNPISRENKDGGLHQPNPMFLTRTIKMSKPTVNGRIVPQNCGRKGRLIGPEISGGIDGIGCAGRVERERSGNGLEDQFRPVLYKAQQRELTPACLSKA